MSDTLWVLTGRPPVPAGPRRPHHNGNTISRPRSYGFCCPECGALWARVVVPGSQWAFWTLPCSECPGWDGALPGSIWLALDYEFLADIPPEFLRREFEIHMTHLAT
jgi:hypothetical protein